MTEPLVDKSLEAQCQKSVNNGVPRGQSSSLAWKRLHRTVESAWCGLQENGALAFEYGVTDEVTGEGWAVGEIEEGSWVL
jgi:hypothetical protein